MALTPNVWEAKVIGALAGTGAASVFATFLIWLLGATVWGVGIDANKAGTAVAAVPGPVTALILVVLNLTGTAIGGYRAPHTPRSVPLGPPPTPAPALPPPAPQRDLVIHGAQVTER